MLAKCNKVSLEGELGGGGGERERWRRKAKRNRNTSRTEPGIKKERKKGKKKTKGKRPSGNICCSVMAACTTEKRDVEVANKRDRGEEGLWDRHTTISSSEEGCWQLTAGVAEVFSVLRNHNRS